jgi:ABC-type Fe3+ transport system permease subunit
MLQSTQPLRGRRVAKIARSWPVTLSLLFMGAFLLVLGGVSAIVFLIDRDCGAAGCGASLAETFVLALGCALLILIAGVPIAFFCYRDWNSVD